MLDTRRVTALLVAAWLGAALLTAVIVAPAAFAVLPTRALAGAVVGRILPVLFVSGAVLALLVWWTARTRERRGALVRFAPVVWFGAMIAAQFGITPRIERIRQSAGGAIDTLPVSDSRRLDFGRLHGVSVGLLGLGVVGALLVLTGRAGTEKRRAN